MIDEDNSRTRRHTWWVRQGNLNTQRAIEPTSHLLGPKEHGRAVSLGLCSLPLLLGLVLVHFRSVGRMRRLCNEREGSLDATVVGPQLLQEPLRVRARRSNACALRRAQEQQVFRPCCAARVVVEYRVEELSLPVPVAPRAPHDVPAVQRQHNGLDAEQHGLVVPAGEQRLDARGGDHARGVLPHVGEQFREHDASDWARSVKGLGRQVADHHGKHACAHREQVARAVLVVAAPEHRQQQPLSSATHDAPDVGDVAAPHTPLGAARVLPAGGHHMVWFRLCFCEHALDVRNVGVHGFVKTVIRWYSECGLAGTALVCHSVMIDDVRLLMIGMLDCAARL